MSGLLREFMNPGNEYTPFPFWFLNGDLKEEKIEAQLRDFCQKGICGAVLHPRIGIPKSLEYLSDEFMRLMVFTVKKAKELNMKVLLYDEGMYPSGSAHGRVVRENPDFAAKGIRLIAGSAGLRERERVLYSLAVRMTGENAYDFDSARLIEDEKSLLNGETALYVVAGFTLGTVRGIHENEDDGQKDAPPAGDLMNYEAMQAFIRHTHERYYACMPEEFGDTVIGFFTDEPSPTGRACIPGMLPWTDGFHEEIEEKGFRPEWYPALWLKADGKEKEVRAEYERYVNYRLIETYYHPISQWCIKHNIALCGHPHSAQDSVMLTEFQIPGQDIVWRWVAPENDLMIGGAESAQAKCASDMARHIGAKRNLNECFGCCGPKGEMWAFNVDDMKWYLNWLFVRGCNFIIPHAFYYELLTPVQADRPPDAGINNIWWNDYKKIADFIKRMCMINTGGVNQARVAVLGSSDTLPVDEVRYFYENQIEFNYLLDAHLLNDCRLENGKIRIRDQAYEAVLVSPAIRYAPGVEEKLKAVRTAGVKVFEKAGRSMNAYATLSFSGKKNMLRISDIIRNGERIAVICNEGEKPYTGVVTLPFDGEIARLDPWTGDMTRIASQDGRARITVGRRAILVLSKAKGAEKLPALRECGKTLRTVPLDKKWVMHLPGGERSGLCDWQEIDEIAVFSGSVLYTASLRLKEKPERAYLELGDVSEMAKVAVNGKIVETLLAPPFTCEIGKYLKKGENTISVTVTNSLVSKYESKPFRSGLFGKTRLRIMEEGEKQ